MRFRRFTWGGSQLMMGHHTRSESLFYYFRLEDHVPEDHLLRLIDKHVDFGFVRDRLKELYSDTGRPSIDPELLLRILLIGYLYGITPSICCARSSECRTWRRALTGSKAPGGLWISSFPVRGLSELARR